MDRNRAARAPKLILCLKIGPEAEAGDFAEAIDAAPWSSALVRLSEPELDRKAVASIVARLQSRGTAVLIDGDAGLARSVAADGVHIPAGAGAAQRMSAIRTDLGPGMLLGADAGRSRHDAMEIGEAGADYVAFGIPEHVVDRATARERQRDLIHWWSEIFEPPSVALDVEEENQAASIAAAGADFIGLTVATGQGPDMMQKLRALIEAVQNSGGRHEA